MQIALWITLCWKTIYNNRLDLIICGWSVPMSQEYGTHGYGDHWDGSTKVLQICPNGTLEPMMNQRHVFEIQLWSTFAVLLQCTLTVHWVYCTLTVHSKYTYWITYPARVGGRRVGGDVRNQQLYQILTPLPGQQREAYGCSGLLRHVSLLKMVQVCVDL